MQTPKKPLPAVNFNLGAIMGEPAVNLADDIKDHLNKYQALWEDIDAVGMKPDSDNPDAPQFGTSLPDDFKLSTFLSEMWTTAHAAGTGVNQLSDDIGDTRTFLDEKHMELASRITDIEVGLGLAPFDWIHGGTVWSALDGISEIASAAVPMSSFEIIKCDVASHESELTNMFLQFSNFKTNVESAIRNMNNRIGSLVPPPAPANPFVPTPSVIPPAVAHNNASVPSVQPAVAPPASTSTSGQFLMTATMYQTLLKDIQDLRADQVRADLKIKSLEQKVHRSEISYNLGGDILRSSQDVDAYLIKHQLRDIDYGGLCDVYNILIRIGTEIAGAGSLAEYTKRQKDSASINQSENESIVNYSFQSMAPPMFAGDKSEKSDIEKLRKHSDWKNRGAMSGLGYEIEKRLQGVRETILQTVLVNYSSIPDLFGLANIVYTTACSFITTFVSWVDSTYEQLTQGGNSPEDVWQLLSKVIRAFFEEGLGPKRVTPTGTAFAHKGDRAAVLIWGVIKTHLATEAMLRGDLRDHPIVTGNYAKWLVNHSGKRDAQELKKEVDKMSKSIINLKETLATKRSVTVVEKAVEAVKKTADKALSKASS